MEIIEPYHPKEFTEYYKFRWELLRKPFGLPKGSEIDDFENLSLHIMAREAGQVIGVGRLTYYPTGEGQVRYMGVAEQYRNKNVGTEILEYLEHEAKKMGLKGVFLNSREESIPFYESNGYKKTGKPFIGFANIEHVRMFKKI